MSENQLERRFIENCEKMSFEELGNYISNCLDKIKTHKNTLKDNPNNLATYDELIKLIESKILDGHIQKVIRDLFMKNYKEQNTHQEQKKYDINKLNERFNTTQEKIDKLIRNKDKKLLTIGASLKKSKLLEIKEIYFYFESDFRRISANLAKLRK